MQDNPKLKAIPKEKIKSALERGNAISRCVFRQLYLSSQPEKQTRASRVHFHRAGSPHWSKDREPRYCGSREAAKEAYLKSFRFSNPLPGAGSPRFSQKGNTA